MASKVSKIKNIRYNVNLKNYSGFRTGGDADYFFPAATLEELKNVVVSARQDGLNITVIGNGSNILFSDRGVGGVVVKLCGRLFNRIEFSNGKLEAGAGIGLARLVRLCLVTGWSGMEFFSGIPGTLGGALAMNAGAMGHEISERLVRVHVMDFDGESHCLERRDVDFVYRSSSLPGKYIITGAEFELEKSDPSAIAHTLETIDEKRAFWRNNPRTCGSVFKNPPQESAGLILDRLGAKKLKVGGAAVSVDHANLIVATPGATSSDVYGLICKLKDLAASDGYKLETEVKMIGEFGDDA